MAIRGTRPLVECALLAALSAVLVLLGWYVPFVGIIASLASPLPVGVAVIRHGTRWGVMSSVVSLFVTVPLIGIAYAVALWAINGAMGISLGIAVRKGFGPTKTLVTAALGSLVSLVIEYAASFFISGITITQQISEALNILRQSFEQTESLLGPNPAVDDLLKALPTVDMMMVMLPAFLVISAFMLAYLNFEIFRRVLPRLGYTIDALPPFSRWIFPVGVAYAGVLAFVAPIFQANMNIPKLIEIAQNVWTMASMLFTLDAVAVASFYMLRSGMSRGMVGFFLVMGLSMIMTTGPFPLLVALFGMIDLLFDFRKIRQSDLDDIENPNQ